MTSCLVVEDHDLTAEGILRAAEGADLHPIRRVSTIAEAVASKGADVILLDLSLPDSCRLDTASKIRTRFPDARVIVLSADVDPEYSLNLLRNGVCGVVGKEVRVARLRQHVEDAIAGGLAITGEIARHLLQLDGLSEGFRNTLELVANDEMGFNSSAAKAGFDVEYANDELAECLQNVATLTNAQMRVLILVDAGLANKAVAVALGIRTKTVERHLRDIRERMGLPERDSRQLGAFAQRLHRGCLLSIEQHLSPTD
jgi:DNA-binding NarL/FixJ family response regulator